MANSSPLAVSKRSDSYWRATFDNPPLNLIDPETIIALRELMDTLEADPAVKVVVFDSADEEYFIAHFDVARGGELPGPGPTGLPAWPDLATRLTCAPFVTIAEIRGRAADVDPGVVHQDVDGSEGVLHLLHEAGDLFASCEVDREARGPLPRGAGDLLRRGSTGLEGPAGHRHLGSRLGQGLRHHAPEPACPAGDQRSPAIQTEAVEDAHRPRVPRA